MQLRQAVDGLIQQVGSRVLEAVPARVVTRVAQAEVGSEIDDRRPRCGEVRHDPRRGAVGKGQEHGVGRRQLRSHREVGRRQVRMVAADRLVLAVATREPDDLDVRMARQQPDELRADVPGRPDDADTDAPRAVPAVRRDATERAGEESRRRLARRDHRGRLETRAHGRVSALEGAQPLTGG